MTSSAVIGLALSTSGLLLVLFKGPKPRMASIGFIFLVMAFVYHAVGEVLQAAFPADALYRNWVASTEESAWAALVGGAILVYSLAYVVTMRSVKQRAAVPPIAEEGWPRWTTMTWLTLPILVTALFAAEFSSAQVSYLAGGLVSQYLVPGITMAAFLYLRQTRRPQVVLAMAAMMIALASLGQRMTVVAGLLMVAWALSLAGRPLRFRQTGVLIALLVFTMVSISSARAAVGREALKGSMSERVSALQVGVRSLGENLQDGAVLGDFVYRIDGNVWPAYVMRRQPIDGVAPLTGLVDVVRSSIPSFVWKSKLQASVDKRDEEAFLDLHYGIPNPDLHPGSGLDWLPTVLGTAYAYGSAAGLLVFAAILGVGLAFADRRLHRRMTFTSVLIGLGLVWCAVGYEGDFQTIFLTMRGVAAVWVVVRVFRLVAGPSRGRSSLGGGGDRPWPGEEVGGRPREVDDAHERRSVDTVEGWSVHRHETERARAAPKE